MKPCFSHPLCTGGSGGADAPDTPNSIIHVRGGSLTMQIKEYEAYTLKECLQQVRSDLGPEAVILETRKFRKGGLLGWGARDAVCIVAATGITVHNDPPHSRKESVKTRGEEAVV